MKFTWLVLFASGCMGPLGFYDIPEVPLRPVVAQPFLDNPTFDVGATWVGFVHDASTAWNEGLQRHGCAPLFAVTDNPEGVAYAINLVPTEGWPHADTAIGITFSGSPDQGYIDIRLVSPFEDTFAALIHELGHALGLGHDDNTDSVMTTFLNFTLVAPTERDLEKLCP